MTRAFICLARNDLPPSELQVLDLWPNTSQRLPPYEPPGQTGYVSFFVQNNLPTVSGAGPILASNTSYGLQAYLLSNIDNQAGGGHKTPSVANCTTIGAAILAAVEAGTALTAAIVDGLVAVTLAGSDLTGGTAAGSTSTGSIVGLLRVLSGEVYRLANGATIAAGVPADFVGNVGVFVTAPDLTPPCNALLGGGTGNGSNSAYGCPVTHQVPAQTGARDVTYRNVRQFTVTGYLNVSSALGVLSKLKAATFSWNNGTFTYNAVTGTARNIAGVRLATNVARGVVVYDAAGNVI